VEVIKLDCASRDSRTTRTISYARRDATAGLKGTRQNDALPQESRSVFTGEDADILWSSRRH
jgi:hypothetical protein